LNTTRFFLACLVRALVLVAVLVVACFSPVVQTWIARREIFRSPGVTGSLGSLTARFGHLEIDNLQLGAGGTSLTLPSLEANLPLTTAATRHQLQVRSVQAVGWTLDLTGRAPAGGTPAAAGAAAGNAGEAEPGDEAGASAAEKATGFFDRLLREWRLPCDLSLGDVDLEGDVLVPPFSGPSPFRVHVVIKGGGLAAGHEGVFVLTAAVADLRLPANAVSAQGSLKVAMDSPRTISRIEFVTDLSAQGGSLTKEVALSADLAAARGAAEEAYTVDLSQDGRHLATVAARYPAATRRLAGSWKIDLRDSDLTPFALDRPLPAFAAAGEGRFEAEAGFTRVRATGKLNATGSRWEAIAPALARIGPASLAAAFDLDGGGSSWRIERLDFSLAGDRLRASVRALQPFDFDGGTRGFKAADAAADWLGISFRSFPLAWLSDPASRFPLSGEAAGDLVARAQGGGFVVRALAPLTASGVSLQGGERALVRGLDLSVPLQASYTTQGWQAASAPLTISRGDRRLGTLDAKAAQAAGADEPLTLTGSWQADLAALAETAAVLDGGGISGRSASGDFSVKLGNATEFEAKLALVGRNPDHRLTASVGGEVDVMGGISFVAPVRVALGPSFSEMSAEGSWSGAGPDSRLDFKLTSENVDLAHLRLLAGPLVAAGNGLVAARAPGAPAGAAGRVPFWGGWAGRVTVAFDHVHTPERDYDDVGGAFDLDAGAIKLEGGRAGIPRRRQVTGAGTLSFDPAAPLPYHLQARAGVDQIDAATFCGTTPKGQDPMLEGKFAVAATLTGEGASLRDLASRTQQQFRVTGTNGILRMLTTSVAEVIPQAETPVKDAVGSVGHAVQDFLEIKRNANADKNPVSPSAEAVLEFTTEITEIGYDQFHLTARRDPDGTLRLEDIAVTSPDSRLTGTGRIDYVAGRPLRARPLHLDLQFGAKAQLAELLAHAALLTGRKDELGYSLLAQPVIFGGTLAQVDVTAWHDLLAKAALREPPPKK
jgi:hypothetical protein